jgi:hypothetical protein
MVPTTGGGTGPACAGATAIETMTAETKPTTKACLMSGSLSRRDDDTNK